MSEKIKRPWFRFSLLTAVLMMLAAGGMLWLNASAIEFMYGQTTELPNGGIEFDDCFGKAYGWPWLWIFDVEPHCRWRGIALVGDVVTLALAIGSTAFVCESILRRREGRKP